MKRICLALFFCFSWSFFSLFADEQDAKTILEQALEKQNNITFTATIISGEGDFRVEQKVLQRKNSDGTVSKRLETHSKIAGTKIYLQNVAGTYDIFPDAQKVLKINFNPADEAPDLSKYTSYELKEGQIDGQKCHIITKRVANNSAVFAIIANSMPSTMRKAMTQSQAKAAILRAFSAISVYYVGMDNLFVYVREYYTFDGKLNGRVAYLNVKIDAKISNSSFDLPSNYSMEYADNANEFIATTNRLGTEVSDKKLDAKRPR
ncbi:MAG: hypothetical protein WCS95_04005 [Lentisphaeria bacterium]